MTFIPECQSCNDLVAAFERSAIRLERAWTTLESLADDAPLSDQTEVAGIYERAMAAHAWREAEYLLHLAMQHVSPPSALLEESADRERGRRMLRHRR